MNGHNGLNESRGRCILARSPYYVRKTIMRTTTLISLVIIGIPYAASAQNKSAIENKLVAEYKLTQPTADQTDIVTAGSILVLKKGNLVMGPATQSTVYQSSYKDGKINPNFAGRLNNGLTRLGRMPGAAPPQGQNTRTFVPGEKMWVTKIECKDDGVAFELFTDAYADVRYRAALKFAFDKHGSMPSADQMSAMVGEVFKVQPADDATGGDQQQQQQQPQAPPARGQRPQAPPPAEPVLAPIAPPPPPPDEPQGPPKELKIGQSKDQVIANFGQPEKVVKLGTKEIYYYKDLGKVTFVNGKVTDVQ
jgi:outer membrane protein assembly factor BamE (lipoprotein component of BamABCDE complex)